MASGQISQIRNNFHTLHVKLNERDDFLIVLVTLPGGFRVLVLLRGLRLLARAQHDPGLGQRAASSLRLPGQPVGGI